MTIKKKPRKKRVLCLGVSYATTTKESNEVEAAVDPPATIETVINCVRQGVLTQMDGRDLVRCISTENVCGVEVYTVSQERGAIYRHDRHLDANFCDRRFATLLRDHFPQCQFDQIVLDYFWSPAGWDACHWKPTFFERTLVDLAELGILRSGSGVIYLPFCLHCFKEIAVSCHVLRQYYDISFVQKKQLHRIALWKGTQQVDSHIMQSVLGKHRQQEETYCSFQPKDIMQSIEDPRISKQELLNFAQSLKNFDQIRFLALRLVGPSSRKARSLSPKPLLVGKIIGMLTGKNGNSDPRISKRFLTPQTTPKLRSRSTGNAAHNITPQTERNGPSFSSYSPIISTGLVRSSRRNLNFAPQANHGSLLERGNETIITGSSSTVAPLRFSKGKCKGPVVTPSGKRATRSAVKAKNAPSTVAKVASKHRYELRSRSPTTVVAFVEQSYFMEDTIELPLRLQGARRRLFYTQIRNRFESHDSYF